jgi:competence protein ComEC
MEAQGGENMKRALFLALFLPMLAPAFPASRNLEMYVIDTEGGKALLLISPSGQSMLIDGGFPGFNGRDVIRIEEAARAARVKRLDFLVVTHYDSDHVDNVPAIVARLPVVNFIDHGSSVANDPRRIEAVAAYLGVANRAKRTIVGAGDRIFFKGVDVQVLTSAGKSIKTRVKGSGEPNPFCENTPAKAPDTTENAQSLGLLFTFGKFRMVDLGDLSWNRELELMCPDNPVGTIDLLMIGYHGADAANSPALIHSLRPKVTIMNNGARKGGSPSVLKSIKASPGLEAAYQLHWSVNAPDDNPPDEFIANLMDSPDGKWIKVSAREDGSFTVTNARNNLSKSFSNAQTPSASNPRQVPDLAALAGLLGKHLDDAGVGQSFMSMNQGAKPEAHVTGSAAIGESRAYFFPAAGVIVCAADYSGTGQRIGQVTLVGRPKRVYLDGQEYAVEMFRGTLPLSLKWGQSRADILRRLGSPAMSNDGVSISDRPKTPIHETRDADEFQQAGVIVRLIYSNGNRDPGCLEEIDLQRTIGPRQ